MDEQAHYRFTPKNMTFLAGLCVRWRGQRGITMDDAALRAGCSPYIWQACELDLPTARMAGWTEVAKVIKLVLRVSPCCRKVYHGEEKEGP